MIRKPTHTPPRSVRIEEALWVAAKERAAERGETVTDVVTRALREYVLPHHRRTGPTAEGESPA